ncbi:MAG: DUF2256 domain-containing protein [Alphaproteobacteria bacterium]|nr:DUF2256 domain-containing protein [Alphaproteobacteria bacterium]
MPNKVKKENLPEKICEVCKRPFTWRKKWQRVWEDIKYCSDKCRKNKSLVKEND